MAEFPYMPFFVGDYFGDTTHLTTLEHGAYLLLLLTAWRNGGWLPDDDELLARYTKMRMDRWQKIAPKIRAFFQSEDGKLLQSRLSHEYEKRALKRSKKVFAANAKWLKNNKSGDAYASVLHMQNGRFAYASHKERKKDTSSNTDINSENSESVIERGVGRDFRKTTSNSVALRAPDGRTEKQKTGTRVADDFEPLIEDIETAKRGGLTDKEIATAHDAFMDYWKSKAGANARKLDWDATWRNWMRKEGNDKRNRQAGKTRH